jgi:23S rRNA (uracil1939-C5)-methyltransferase
VAEPEPIFCPHAERCPGCPWIALGPDAQRAAKQERLARALAPYTTLRAQPLPVHGTEALTGYRTRAKLVVAAGPRLGLHERGGHEVIDLPGCRVLAPSLAAAAQALRALLAAPPADAEAVLRPDRDGPGRLRAVDLREVWDEQGAGLLLTLVVREPEPEPRALETAADALAAAIPGMRSLALRLHDGRAPGLLGRPPRTLRGEALLRDRLRPDGPFELVGSGSFTQAHRAQAAALQQDALRALGALRGRRVLDVYAGSGGLGLALAARGAAPVLVEAFLPAARAAEAAARAQGLALEVHARPAEVALPELKRAGVRFDGAVANPPRAGLPPRVREALAGLVDGPLVYVSCEPATLARDLAHLAELGWRCERLEPWDLMPLTDQVECLAVLRRAPPPPLGVLYEDRALVAVAKAPFLPSVPHPEHPDSLLARVRALPGREGVVPLGRLDAGTSGVCLFAASPAQAGALQRALAAQDAERRYLALVRGVGRARGRIARALGERAARTRYRRLAVVAGHALLEVAPESGRTHQIRRHLASIGEPVLGDARHGHAPSNRHLFERAGLDRPFLHCASVAFRHPITKARLRIEAPLAPDLASVLARLGFDLTSLAQPGPEARALPAAAAPPV